MLHFLKPINQPGMYFLVNLSGWQPNGQTDNETCKQCVNITNTALLKIRLERIVNQKISKYPRLPVAAPYFHIECWSTRGDSGVTCAVALFYSGRCTEQIKLRTYCCFVEDKLKQKAKSVINKVYMMQIGTST